VYGGVEYVIESNDKPAEYTCKCSSEEEVVKCLDINVEGRDHANLSTRREDPE
jgi:hypothetical protein